MKINKSRLQKIIQEEVENHFQEGRRESFPTMEIDPAELEKLGATGEEKHNKIEELKRILLEKLGAEKLLEEILDNVNANQLERILTMVAQGVGFLQEEEEVVDESPQHGGSVRKGPRDFDLKTTSTNWGERDKKKNFQKKFIGAKPGGARKQYKKQANKKEREQGKKQAKGEQE